jgi:hypothetical protein
VAEKKITMSIPSKWQPPVLSPEKAEAARSGSRSRILRPRTVHGNDTSTKGFGICTARFDNNHINDLPGNPHSRMKLKQSSRSLIFLNLTIECRAWIL